jgi:hypothetical protein
MHIKLDENNGFVLDGQPIKLSPRDTRILQILLWHCSQGKASIPEEAFISVPKIQQARGMRKNPMLHPPNPESHDDDRDLWKILYDRIHAWNDPKGKSPLKDLVEIPHDNHSKINRRLTLRIVPILEFDADRLRILAGIAESTISLNDPMSGVALAIAQIYHSHFLDAAKALARISGSDALKHDKHAKFICDFQRCWLLESVDLNQIDECLEAMAASLETLRESVVDRDNAFLNPFGISRVELTWCEAMYCIRQGRKHLLLHADTEADQAFRQALRWLSLNQSEISHEELNGIQKRWKAQLEFRGNEDQRQEHWNYIEQFKEQYLLPILVQGSTHAHLTAYTLLNLGNLYSRSTLFKHPTGVIERVRVQPDWLNLSFDVFEQARKLYRHGMRVHSQIRTLCAMGRAKMVKANLERKKNNDDEAIRHRNMAEDYFSEAKKLNDALEIQEYLCDEEIGRGTIALFDRNFSGAKKYFVNALSLAINAKNFRHQNLVHAWSYRMLSYQPDKNVAQMSEQLRLGAAAARKVGIEIRSEFMEQMAQKLSEGQVTDF